MKDDSLAQMLAETGDEPMSNLSANPTFESVLERRLSRRGVLRGSLSGAVAGLFAASPVAALARNDFLPPAAAGSSARALNPVLGFDAIPATRSDTATLPFGYKAQALVPWGTPITGGYPAYDGVNGNSGAEQEQQVGSHHDGIHYFPL
ncbi:MAG: alkaline phosphatase PhoX, partial [Gammaproteobacteria bacterium]